MKPPQIVTCQECQGRFERARRGAMPKYCPECRAIVNRKKIRERDADQRAEIAGKRDTLRQILEPMREYLTGDMILTAEQFIATLAPDSDVIPLVNDQQPAGTRSPSGSDDGVTTAYDDVDAQLEDLRLAAVMHDWHAEHPGWWDG